MTLQACAEITRDGDPDRFLAAMAAPPVARAVLFPLYAFNVEVSRAPWVTEEPMIAEMRLQWWRDALEEIAQGKPVRSHEVTQPLAEVLDEEGARALDRLVAARRWDIHKDAFEDAGHFAEFLDATAGGLMWTATRLLGGRDLAEWQSLWPEAPDDAPPSIEDNVRDLGYAAGLARFLQAVPELEARGRVPLVDGRPAAVQDLASHARVLAGHWGLLKRMVPRAARPGMLEGWQAAPLLKKVQRDPSCVAEGRLALSPFRKKLRLLRWAV